jgi:hydrogenase maturation protease
VSRMLPRKEILIAGVGNVFLSDDGFGVEVARRLAGRDLPTGVEVADIGIRGMHLAYRLLDGYRVLVLVDAVRQGHPPGTLYLLEHDLDGPADEAARFDAHGMDPGAVLTMLDQLAHGVGVERPVDRVLVVGCEPHNLDEGIGLSDPVAAVVDRAAQAVVDLVGDLQDEEDRNDQVAAGGRVRGGGGGGRHPEP